MGGKEQVKDKKQEEIEICINKINKDDSFEEFTFKWIEINKKGVDLLKQYVGRRIRVFVCNENCPGEIEDEFLEGNVNGLLEAVEVDKIVLLVESEEGDHSRYGLGEQKIFYRESTISKDKDWGLTYSIKKIKIPGKNIDFLFSGYSI